MTGEPMVRLERFEKRYGKLQAVWPLDLEIARGESFALLGPNGGGKTSVLRALVGLHAPSAGRVLVGGVDVARSPDEAKARLSFVPQRVSLPGMLTAREILTLFAGLKKAPPGRVAAVLEEFELEPSADRRVAEYSGGMLQRLGLAIGFLREVELLVLDEPTVNLDPPGILQLQQLLHRLKARGTTIVFSSHLLRNAVELADRVGVLVAGRMVEPEEAPAFHEAVTRRTTVRIVVERVTDDMVAAARQAGGDVSGHNGREVSFTARPDQTPPRHSRHREGGRRHRGVPHRRPGLGGPDPGAPGRDGEDTMSRDRRSAALFRTLALVLAAAGLAACSGEVVPEVVAGVDACAYCNMVIDDVNKAAGWIEDGEFVTFDSPGCLLAQHEEQRRAGETVPEELFFAGYQDGFLHPAATVAFLLTSHLPSAMGSGAVTFASRSEAEAAREYEDEVLTDWVGYRTARGTPDREVEVSFGPDGMVPSRVEVEKGELVEWAVRSTVEDGEVSVSIKGYPEVEPVRVTAGAEPAVFRVLATRPGSGFPIVEGESGAVLGTLVVRGPPHRGRGSGGTVSSPVLAVGWNEFLINRRNRWVVSFAVLFAVATLAIAYFGMVTSGYAGFQDFTRTAASLVNVGGFLIPLFALVLGVFSFITHPEYLELLVTQPVSRGRILLGRYLGLSLTVLGAAALGFGLPGAMIAVTAGRDGALRYLAVIAYLSLLALAFTGIALLITLLARRRQIALGVALGVWILYELIYGVAMLASTLYLPARVLETTLLVGLLGNPVDLARVLSLLQVGGPHLFGPAGATLVKLTGSVGVATAAGLAGLLLWVVVPFAVAVQLFKRQNL